MGELQLGEAAAQQTDASADTGRQIEQTGEVDPTLKAKTRIAELLRPPEKTATKIQELVFCAGAEIIKKHPHPEMKRIVETAAGVFLWEQNASPITTENTLPLGLATHVDEHNKIASLEFDAKYLSYAEYSYVIGAFRSAGVVTETERLQNAHLSEKHKDITDAVIDYLPHSPAGEFLQTFMVEPQTDKSPARNLRDLTDAEEAQERARLEGNFEASLDPKTEHDPGVQMERRMKVDKPLAMATTYDTTQTANANGESATLSRARLRTFIEQELFLPDRNLPKEVWGDIHVEEESRRFYLQQPDGTKSYIYDDSFFTDLAARFDNTLYKAPTEYSRLAFHYLIGRLYNKDDTRDSEEIINEGYAEAADVIATVMSRPRYHPLTESIWDYDHALDNLLWLNTATGPTHEVDDPAFENIKDAYRRTSFIDSATNLSAYELARKQERTVGEITHIDPAVLIPVPRIISHTYRDRDLPLFPTSQTDLVLKSESYNLTKTAGTGSPDTSDPAIKGMQLVARNDETLYFVHDDEKDPYKPSSAELSYIQRRNAADFFQEIGMQELASQVDTYDSLTIAQMVSLMRKHVQYTVPEQTESVPVSTEDYWQKQINAEGKLQGQSRLFADFTAKVFTIMYPISKTDGERIAPIDGFPLDNPENVTQQTHWQTQIILPHEDINIIVDIAPPMEELHMITDQTPHIPPPPPEPIDWAPMGSAARSESQPYVDTRPSLEMLSAQEYKEALKEHVGEIRFVEPEVFADTQIRLFSKVPRVEDLPTSREISRKEVDLEIEIKGTDLADAEHDPALAGMQLVAREGNRYFFSMDPESADYKPVLDPVPTQMQNELAITCLKLKMVGLAEEIKTADELTVDKLQQMVRRYCRVSITDEGVEPFRIDSIMSLAKNGMIDTDGVLNGQGPTFEFFWRKLGDIIDGEGHNKKESGHVLRNTKFISKLNGTQTRRINRYRQSQLIEISPLRYNIPDLDQQELIENLPNDDPPIIVSSLDDRQISSLIDDLREGRGWDDELRTQKPLPKIELDDDAAAQFIKAWGELTDLPLPEPPQRTGGQAEMLNMLPSEEFKEVVKETVGEVLFVEPVVFEQAKMRLFSKVKRADDMPTSKEIGFDTIDLGIEIKGTDLADAEHDPALAGMQLVARDGNRYFFAVDPESTDYKPVTAPISPQTQNELAVTCLELKMTGLAEEIETADDLTVEKLRQLVRSYCRYTITEEGKEPFPVTNIMDLAENGMVDEKGVLGGQCETFEFFWRKLADKIDGPGINTSEGGIVLRNTTGISKAGHAQTRRNKPGEPTALIDVSPLRYNDADIDEELGLADLPNDDPPVIKKLSDEQVVEMIQHIKNGGTVETTTSRPTDPVLDLDDESSEKLDAALLESIKNGDLGSMENTATIPTNPATDFEVDSEDRPATTETLDSAISADFTESVREARDAETKTGKVRRKLKRVRERMKKPFRKSALSTASDRASIFGSTSIHVDKPVPSLTAAEIDAPVKAPPVQIVKTTELTLPIAEQPAAELPEQVVLAQERNALRSANEAFLMGLTSYLGLKPGSEQKSTFIDHVVATNGREIALRDPELAGRTLHLQVLSMVDKFRQLENGTLIETEVANISKTLDRLGGIIRMYKDRPKGFVRLLQQRRYPTYDQRFLGIMEKAVNAYTDWNKTRVEKIVAFPEPERPEFSDPAYAEAFRPDSTAIFVEQPVHERQKAVAVRSPKLSDPAYNNLFRDRSTTFEEVPIEKKPQTTAIEKHPERARLEDLAYGDQFKRDANAEFDIGTSANDSEPEPHPQQDLLSDTDYTNRFQRTAPDTLTAPETPPQSAATRQTTLPEGEELLTDPEYLKQFKRPADRQQ